MNILASVLLLATLNFAIVAYLTAPLKQQKWFEPYAWLVVYASFLTGLAFSLAARINVMPELAPAITDPVVGMILTACMVGGGASLIHDVLDRQNSG